ncbi:hypothetical protein GCM10017608_13490 [Agromyces luteolus]|uniref:Uncharacterized protein n=1 Tax=Agromyces luteolus TaxID=88373 RepID=A0A7C9HI77_9MICO|nr:hypothetical protein [Agromyces luteolus]MUN07648.1 hypothetical protein [Agromyces luteolus]GLK27415.1 hypothetical protein GCM10017608_13490 [Agromyces luteolus]
MSADGPATSWARTASGADVAYRLSRLDRAAVSAVPRYADQVDACVSETVAGLRTARAEGLVELRARDGSAGAELGRSGARTAALVGGVLAACFAAAFHLGRAVFDAPDVLPWITGLVWTAAILIAAALLPLRRAAAPTTGVVATVWSAAALCLAALVMSAVLGGLVAATAGTFVAAVAGLAVLVGVASAATVVALGASPAERAATRRRMDEFARAQADLGGSVLADAIARLGSAWAAVDPAVRARVEDDLASAHRILDERGMPPRDRPGLPGELVLTSTAVAASPELAAAFATGER